MLIISDLREVKYDTVNDFSLHLYCKNPLSLCDPSLFMQFNEPSEEFTHLHTEFTSVNCQYFYIFSVLTKYG